MATRGRKAAPKTNSSTLLTALEFVANAQDESNRQSSHCFIKDGWCVATNGVLTMGAKVEDNFQACPQTKRLIAALRRCGDSVAFTQLDRDRISVKSGSIRVVIPCVELPPELIVWADTNQAAIGQAFLDGIAAISHIASDGGDVVYKSSLLCRDQTISVTNGVVLIEYWHGFSTPPYWVLPKVSATALLKVTKKLTGFGYSGNSATFHYEDGSWLKTQLFEDKWPALERLFDNAATARTPIPKGFFEAVNILAEFSDSDGMIDICDDKIEIELPHHAEHAVPGAKGNIRLAIRQVQSIQKVVKFISDPNDPLEPLSFTGDNLRGLIMPCKKRGIEQT